MPSYRARQLRREEKPECCHCEDYPEGTVVRRRVLREVIGANLSRPALIEDVVRSKRNFVPLKFERAHYEGTIENNVLHLPPLLLSQGYEDSIVSADFVLNEYSEPYIQAFRADVQEGVVTVSMSALDQTVIDQNNFIYLQIEATATSGTATSVITLEIIKDDNVTPVFEKPIYTGSYEPGKELIIEQISFSQGYDGVDSLLFDGEHKTYFAASRNGPHVTIEVSNIPPELFNLGRIELSLQATKPRTVGATTTVIVTLPAVVPLKFERAHYEGTIENNVLHLPPLLLSQGYEDSIVSADFVLNEYSEPYIQAFRADVQEGVVTVSMSALDQTVIDQNNFIYLQIEATATSGTATSVITLEIIKDDNVTPVFEKPIYTGSYEPGKELIIEQISFSQGYDGVDSLLFDGEHKTYFAASRNGPHVTIEVSNIPPELFNLGRIELSLQATKPRTVGATTTVIVTLPAVVPLKFERAHYEGTIENNVLHLPPLLLSQGYEDSIVSADFVLNEYSEPYIQAFRADVQEGVVTVSMSALDQTVIDQNNFIYLQIEATATSGTATSVITLEIIKDDNVTPVFEKPIYTGSYEPGKELIIEQISFSQGYDGVDSLLFDGEHKTYFAASRNGPHVTIEVSNIPPELFNLGRIELSLQATKPRTVGATTTVIVTLPAVVPLKFERAHYEGTIENNVLHLPPLLLSQGYEDSIVSADFVLNEYSEPYIQAFRADVQESVVTVSMSALDQTVIDQNNFIYLQIEATATSGTATSVITLEIIKDDNVTPVFEKPIYTGSYEPGKELIIEQISFSQGYDGVDSLLIDGEHKTFFAATRNGPHVTIGVSNIPPELFSLGRIELSLQATKPRTVGATTTVIVTLPAVVPLKFERAHYEGTIENNVLHLPPLLLSQGYEDSIVSADFVLNEYSEPYIQAFTADVQEGVVTVSMSALDQTVIDQNNFIYLQIEATATSGTATSVITLEIIKDDNVTPVFEKPIYTGSYEPGKELIIEQISFSQGYDGVDSLLIDGEHKTFFAATRNGPHVTIGVSNIPPELFSLGRIELSLQATKPRTVGATTTVIVTLPAVVPLKFERAHYEGTIENNVLHLPPLLLSQGYEDSIVSADFVLNEYSEPYIQAFRADVQEGVVTVSMSALDQTVIDQNNFIYLQIEATATSGTATSVITLEIIKDDNVTPVFEKPIYTGSYEPGKELIIEQISFSQGYDGVDSLLFDGEHKTYFAASRNGPHVTIEVSNIPPELFNLGRIELSLQATKPRTVGATTTVIVTLPAVVPLKFERAHYEGTIENNVLHLPPLLLSQGYEDSIVSADFVLNEYSEPYIQAFRADVQEGVVTVSMSALDQTVIDQNNFIYLQIEATATSGTATSVITLEIIKDDNVTPVFEKPIYTGSYEPGKELIIEQISFSQGYDGVDSLLIDGEHKTFFAASRNGPHVTIEVSNIPPELFSLGRIELSLQATKPRTVGATTAVIITLPAGSQIGDDVYFERVLYEGTVQDNDVQHEEIRIFGFDGTSVELHGENSNLFKAEATNGLVSVRPDGLLNLPPGITRVALELHVGSARAVLLLNVKESGSQIGDDVYFERVLYEGTVQDNDVQHEEIRIFGFDGTSVELHGENSNLFKAEATNGLVSVRPDGLLNLPPGITRVALELHVGSARAVLLLNVKESGSQIGDDVYFERVLYEGTVQDNDVQHEEIRIFGFDGTSVELHGENSNLFKAEATNGLVSVRPDGSLNLPPGITRVALELHVGSARAVLLLNVRESGSQIGDDVYFERVLYEGTVQDNDVQHEEIRIFGFDGTSVELHGENSNLFKAEATNGLVSVRPDGSLNLPPGITRVALELHVGSARAVLLLNVRESGSQIGDDVYFERVLYEGTVQDNDVQHEEIRIFGFDGTSVELHGENSNLFKAEATNGLVSVRPDGLLNLPPGITRVALELHVGSARAVLLLNVKESGSQIGDDVYFERVLYEGTVQDNDVQHEEIRIFGFDGTSVELHGENSNLFKAEATNGLVSVRPDGLLNLPPGITRVALELHVGSARAVLLLNVKESGSQIGDDVYFERVLYEGTVQDNDVQHEEIRIFGFDGTSVELHGENSNLFKAEATNGLVSVRPDGSLNLPPGITRVALELHVGSARAVLLLNVRESGSQIGDDVYFERVLYEGTVQDNDVQHEEIRIFGFDGTSVELHGENSNLFKAEATNGLVSVRPDGLLNLPPGITRVALELHVGSARAVLLLNVKESGSQIGDDVYFERVLYEGTVQDNDVQHEEIRIFGFDGTSVELHGENSNLFKAEATNGLVSVRPDGSLNLPPGITRVALELHVGSARAVLLLNVRESGSQIGDDVYFERVLYEGTVQDNDVQHEEIRIFGFDGTSVELHGENSNLFKAEATNGLVSVRPDGSLNLPPGITRVALELHVGSARAVLLLNVRESGSQIGDDVYFERVLYEGTVQDNDVQHEEIRIFGFDGTSVELHGENSNLFKAEATNGLVSVRPDGSLNLPPGITRVALELHVGSARAVLLLNVRESGSQIGDDVYFERVLYEGTVQDNDVQHEEIRIFGFDGTSVELHGENSNLFKAEATNGLVSVRPDGSLNLPPGITRVALELHVGSARAVLLLNVRESGSQIGDDVYFERVLYEGTVQDNDVQHEEIRIFGFDGTSVELHGENSNLFKAEATNGLVSVRPDGSLNLPPGITRVALELHVGSARAVLLLNVRESGSQIGDDVYFERVLYEGTVQDNDVQHEEIRIFGFDGTSVELHGENSNLFKAEATNGLVSVRPDGSLNLPPGITRVALELHVGSARAVLLLNVRESGSQIGDDVYFERALYEGTVQDNDVQHEEIRIFGFDGTSVELHGENSNLFKAEATNGLVSVRPDGSLNLPPGITRVALELHVGSARAVLLLNVRESGSQIGDDVYFERVLYEGTVQDNDVQHEEIRIFGFDGTSVELHGENSNLFKAEATNGLVSVRPDGSLNLPPGITRVALELHVGSARAVLLLNVRESGSQIGDDVYFERVLYEGTVQDNDVQHEEIRIFGFDGTSVELHGENSNLFKAEATNGLVSVRPDGSLNLPPGITRVALELHVGSARAVLLLNVRESGSQIGDDVYFERVLYEGTVQDNDVQHEEIRIFGFDGTSVELHGENSNLFKAEATNGLVSVRPDGSLNLPPGITRVALELHVGSARAVLLLNVRESGSQIGDDVYFERVLYEGTVQDNDVQHEEIRIFGFDGTSVELHGENSNLFKAEATNGLVSVRPDGSLNLPPGITRVALELHVGSARAVLLLNVRESGSQIGDDVYFERVLYEGTVQDNDVQHEEIRIFGFDGTSVELHGENSNLFKAEATNGLVSVRPDGSLNLPPGITRVALELHVGSARAVLLLNVRESGSQIGDDVYFERVLYEGTVQDNDVQHEEIRIFGFDGTSVELHGENSNLFKAEATNGLVSVRPDGSLNLPPGITRVALELHVGSARAVLLLNVRESGSQIGDDVYFERVLYEGTVQDNDVQHEEIRIFGFDGTSVELHGENSNLFKAEATNGLVSVRPDGSLNLPPGITRVALELHVGSARAVLLLNVRESGSQIGDDVYFERVLYEGTVQDNDVQHEEIRIFGFDGTSVELHGENSNLFKAEATNGLVSVRPDGSLNLPPGITRVALELHVGSARAVLLLNVRESGSQIGDDVYFERVLYEGTVQDNDVQHEEIRIFGFDGTSVELHGENSYLFKAEATNGLVSVRPDGLLNLPPGITRVALELHVGSARAVLLLNVRESEVPGPSVEFSSESYAVSISSTQTGLVGRVSATASNNEAIAYSLRTDNAHLVSRLSINNEGELHLSTPADSGVYTFQVIAATVNSEAMATATVHLTVQETPVCDDRGIVVPPLIVIDKDEEEEHRNLVVLDPTQHEGCRYTMASRWPTQQTWLYADETGLHARAIDREDKSIAFMTVSQVQVELMLQCDNDPVRTKRSIRSYDWLDPYEYGSNKWILTESIPYNSRRTLVNLIVNDINDNAPIFVGKENEPIAVGYPNGELEERILPRSLAELQATDADIGINAAIRYSSSESVLAVAPTTGFVHVRSGASLQHDQILTVTATDQNGEGLSGNIQLIVKLLDINHIAVVTVRDVFLDDEKTVLAQLSDAVGYEVKVLRSVVVSDDINEDVTRQKRETNPRTSLQLFVYGLVQQEPVVVSQLASDLNSQAIIQNIATIPLETHLENGNMALQSTVGLLVATIVLGVLLFAALCVIAVWFFLRWRKNRNYNQFSDDASLASARNASLGELTKPEEVRPRLNIEELKRSEKRLQERLAQVTPMEQVTVEPMPRQLEPPAVAILDVPVPEHNTPIVIQSIDKLKDADDESDNDEFGEVKKARRKSVVTFNENVEKIIHVQDDVEESEGDGILTVDSGDAGSSSTDDITVYRL
ncbi:unnamed protein product [Spodoptera exigua]|nr:unnamed protein product [Spodoptera exigua]